MNSYQTSLVIERFNDGKYKLESSIGGKKEFSGHNTTEDLFKALDDFKQKIVDHEEQLDS